MTAPRQRRAPLEERVVTAVKKMILGTGSGRVLSAAPARFQRAGALGRTSVGAGVGTFLWNSHPDEIPDGALGVPFYPTFGGVFTSVRTTCGRSPSGGAATFDLTLNGVSVLPSLTSIADGGTVSADVTPSTTVFSRDDELQVVCGTSNGVLDVIAYIDYTRTS